MITGPVPVPPQDTPKPRRSRQSARALNHRSVLDVFYLLAPRRDPHCLTTVTQGYQG
jgi:1-acyl-sn-glycerol-3-phosphate acyltransferase